MLSINGGIKIGRFAFSSWLLLVTRIKSLVVMAEMVRGNRLAGLQLQGCVSTLRLNRRTMGAEFLLMWHAFKFQEGLGKNLQFSSYLLNMLLIP
ncbi:uncharacterized protein DS421_18g629600 [Arachis hypogaea]|nr:uncharacterized protein DS421_18g629600 [Arachis hypogaea]